MDISEVNIFFIFLSYTLIGIFVLDFFDHQEEGNYFFPLLFNEIGICTFAFFMFVYQQTRYILYLISVSSLVPFATLLVYCISEGYNKMVNCYFYSQIPLVVILFINTVYHFNKNFIRAQEQEQLV